MKEEGNELDIAIDRQKKKKKKDLEADGNESIHT